MKQINRKLTQTRLLAGRLGAVAAVFLCLGLWVTTSASATYEQVDAFAGTPGTLQISGGTEFQQSKRWPEEVQLGGTGGMAVNINGVGGVPAGTVYAATRFDDEVRVARFNHDGEFREAWTFAGNPPDQRCGPEGDPAHPLCASRPSGVTNSVDIEVDQATGYVYLFNGESSLPGDKLIHVYSPDGSELISEFGVRANAGETIAASPEKLHGRYGNESIAVDNSGTVYVYDSNNAGASYHRLMVFEPQSAGDLEHYVYAGQGHDIWAGSEEDEPRYATKPITDSVGNVYVAGETGYIAELDPSQPSAPPLCEFKFAPAGIVSMTVNPDSGEVFFYSEKDKTRIRQLSPCNGEGKFVETGSINFLPRRVEIGALAFNPTRQFDPSRSPGVLYAGTPGSEGGKTEPDGNGGTLTESALGYIFAPPVGLPPEVESESVSHVTATTALLRAEIDPKGSKTSYVFQYATEAAYKENGESLTGAATAPLGGAVAGEGQKAIAVAAALSGLAPDTAYRYRVIATSSCSACEDIGPTQGFHTFPVEAPGLPDHRAYELVSPADKHGGQVLPPQPTISSCGNTECKPGGTYAHFPMQSSPDGETIVYEGTPFSFSEGGSIENEYASRRTGSGWQTTNLTPPLLQKVAGYRGFSTDLTQGLFEQGTLSLSPAAPAGYANLYLQPIDAPLALSPLLTNANASLHRPAGTGGGALVLRYAGASADLSRVFFTANDALTSPAGEAGEKTNLYEWDAGQLRQVNVLPGNSVTEPGAKFGESSAHAISADGSHAFWSDESGQVYVRIDGSETRKIEDPGKFLSASVDGSKVLLDDGCLYDLEEGECEDLTAGKGGFRGIAGQSDDLSHVYFIDDAALAAGAVARACQEPPSGTPAAAEEEEGKVPPGFGCNLYAWNEGATAYIGTLLAGDNGTPRLADWQATPFSRTAEASPDGRWVAFMSQVELTGVDNIGSCHEISGTGKYHQAPCAEAFLYDSATGRLHCASCNPSGAGPLAPSVLRVITGTIQARFLTDSGRLYFDSQDSLVPADTNAGSIPGRAVEDAYQYEPAGVGSCEREGGCVSLISAGTGTVDSNFLTVDPSGKNVFFTSRDQLTPKDRDELIDIYDARENGGIAAETETAGSQCQGESCQPVPVPPNDPTPASLSFEGPGNVVKKPTARRHKHKHKKKKSHHKRTHARAAGHDRGGAK